MSIKFNLNWKLIYQKKDKSGNIVSQLQIPANDNEENLTCDFTIERSYDAKINQSNIKIYNLSPNTKAILKKDKARINEFDKISFYAGYGSDLNLIFTGNVLEAKSYDISEVNCITEIKALDGSFLTYQTTSNHNVSSNVSYEVLFNKLFNDLQVNAKKVGDDFSLEPLSTETQTFLKNTKTKQALTLYGNTWEVMSEYFSNGLFIENNKLNYLPILHKKEGDVFVVSAETGLTSSPKPLDLNLTIETVFEPKIKAGSIIEIQTKRYNFFSGRQYKVFGIKHANTISQTTEAKVITTLSLGRFDSSVYYSIL